MSTSPYRTLTGMVFVVEYRDHPSHEWDTYGEYLSPEKAREHRDIVAARRAGTLTELRIVRRVVKTEWTVIDPAPNDHERQP